MRSSDDINQQITMLLHLSQTFLLGLESEGIVRLPSTKRNLFLAIKPIIIDRFQSP